MSSPRFNVQLQGRIKDNPDKEIIDGIVESIKKQDPFIETGTKGPVTGMFLSVPNFYLIYKTFKGRDLQVLVMGINRDVLIHIKELVRYEDVAWGFLDNNEKEIPEDMIKRLKQRS